MSILNVIGNKQKNIRSQQINDFVDGFCRTQMVTHSKETNIRPWKYKTRVIINTHKHNKE